jgi:hypothetical protein
MTSLRRNGKDDLLLCGLSISHSGSVHLFCDACSCEIIWSACRQGAIQCIEWRMNKYTYNYA